MIDLTTFDIILVNTSAGKDSLAMTFYLVELAETQGVRSRLVAAHADLGRCEWPGTRVLAEAQCQLFDIPLHVISKDRDLLDQVEARGKWPDAKNRYCTSDQKRDPINKVVTRLVREYKAAHPEHQGRVRVLNCLGFRAEESPARAKKAAVAPNVRWTNKTKREVTDWLPIHTWTVAMVWWQIGLSGAPYHYAYDLGMPRLSCVFCIFSPTAMLLIAGRHNQKLLGQYVAVERRIKHTFRVNLPIAYIAEKVAQ